MLTALDEPKSCQHRKRVGKTLYRYPGKGITSSKVSWSKKAESLSPKAHWTDLDLALNGKSWSRCFWGGLVSRQQKPSCSLGSLSVVTSLLFTAQLIHTGHSCCSGTFAAWRKHGKHKARTQLLGSSCACQYPALSNESLPQPTPPRTVFPFPYRKLRHEQLLLHRRLLSTRKKYT